MGGGECYDRGWLEVNVRIKVEVNVRIEDGWRGMLG